MSLFRTCYNRFTAASVLSQYGALYFSFEWSGSKRHVTLPGRFLTFFMRRRMSCTLAMLLPVEFVCIVGFGSNEVELEAITRFTELRQLGIVESNIGPDTCRYISSLRSLEYLSLAGSSVSDAAIRFVMHLPKLRRLVLSDTAVTTSCISVLKQHMKECEIVL